MKLKIYDNLGKFFDRYTVVYLDIMENGFYEFVGMSENPLHPQGFCQHGYCIIGDHLGREIKFEDLPEDCQRAVRNDLEELE